MRDSIGTLLVIIVLLVCSSCGSDGVGTVDDPTQDPAGGSAQSEAASATDESGDE
jgi:hypothetical protein